MPVALQQSPVRPTTGRLPSDSRPRGSTYKILSGNNKTRPISASLGSGEDDRTGISRDSESSQDWRSFRAKLVAQQQQQNSGPGSRESEHVEGSDSFMWESRKSIDNFNLLRNQNPTLASESIWAHSLTSVEEGAVLLAGPGMNLAIDERYWQTTILVVQNIPALSWGLILNRPSGYSIQQILSDSISGGDVLAPFKGCVVYIGGFKSDGRSLYVVHGHKLEGALEVTTGVFIGGLEAASKEVAEGKLSAADFRFFIGRVEWLPGSLDAEVARREWYIASCARSLILKHCLQLPTPLWKEILELMGGEYAATARRAYRDM